MLAYVIAFLATSAVPQFLHRRDFDKAYFAYYKNPTPENEVAFRKEQRKNELIYLTTDAVIALGFVSLGYTTYFVISRMARAAKSARSSNFIL